MNSRSSSSDDEAMQPFTESPGGQLRQHDGTVLGNVDLFRPDGYRGAAAAAVQQMDCGDNQYLLTHLLKFAYVYNYKELSHTPDTQYLGALERIPDITMVSNDDEYEKLNQIAAIEQQLKLLKEHELKSRGTPAHSAEDAEDAEDDDMETEVADGDDSSSENKTRQHKRGKHRRSKHHRKERRHKRRSSQEAETETALPSRPFMSAAARVCRTDSYDYTKPSYMLKNDMDHGTFLQYMENQTLPIQEVLGAETCIKMLINVVAKPLLNPLLYRDLCAKSRLGCMYGPKGSGKLTVIKSFCREFGLTLIHVHGQVWTSPEMMEHIVEYAKQVRRVVIYFDHCDHWFVHGGIHDGFGHKFFLSYEKEYDAAACPNIWVVFGMEMYPSQFIEAHRDKLVRSGHTARMNPPNLASRRQFMHRLITTQFDKMGGRDLDDDEYLELIQDVAACGTRCSYDQMTQYCKKVFGSKFKRIPIDLLKQASIISDSIKPDRDDFYLQMFKRGERYFISPIDLCGEDSISRERKYQEEQHKMLRSSNPDFKRSATDSPAMIASRISAQSRASYSASGLSRSATSSSQLGSKRPLPSRGGGGGGGDDGGTGCEVQKVTPPFKRHKKAVPFSALQ